MKRFAPLLTMAVIAALGVTLAVVNGLNDPARTQDVAAAGALPAATPGPTPSPAAAPDPLPPTVTPTVDKDAPAIAEVAYVGRSSGNEVTVAVAVKDGRAVAYVCNGKQIEAWLEGTLQGDRLALQGDDGGLTGTVTAGAALGSVTVGSTQWPFSAKVVQAPEGLYEGRANIDGVANRIGWIVIEGKQVGLRDAGGELVAAPPLDPTDLRGVSVDGVGFAVRAVTGADAVVGR